MLELICDLGSLVTTLLMLYSDTAAATRLDTTDDDLASLRRNIAFAYTSCALSLMSFVVSSVGVARVYKGLRQAVRRSSAAVRTGLARVAVAPVMVRPLDDSTFVDAVSVVARPRITLSSTMQKSHAHVLTAEQDDEIPEVHSTALDSTTHHAGHPAVRIATA